MHIQNFDHLLEVARSQSDPQRLLLVFVGAELPDDCTPEQRADFEAGHGGALVPLMCVDKWPEQLLSFSALTEEADAFGLSWRFVLAGALSGVAGQAPSDEATTQALDQLVEQVKRGRFETLIPFDHAGLPVSMA